jgi:hypothetical protein
MCDSAGAGLTPWVKSPVFTRKSKSRYFLYKFVKSMILILIEEFQKNKKLNSRYFVTLRSKKISLNGEDDIAATPFCLALHHMNW